MSPILEKPERTVGGPRGLRGPGALLARILAFAALALASGGQAGAQVLMAHAPANGHPAAVAVDPTTGMVYTADPSIDSVEVFDGISNQQRASLSLGSGSTPVAVAVDPSTHRVYVANKGNSTVTVLAGAAGNTATSIAATWNVGVGAYPCALAVDPVRHRVYVADSNGGRVLVFDGSVPGPSSTWPIATVTVGAGPTAIAVDPSTGAVFVANTGDGTVTRFDTVVQAPAANLKTFSIGAGAAPVALAVDPASHLVFVAASGTGQVAWLDDAQQPTTGSLPNVSLSAIHASSSPVALAVNLASQQVLVADGGADGLWAIAYAALVQNPNATLPGAAVTLATLTGAASDVAVNALTNRAYVVDAGGGVNVFNLNPGNTLSPRAITIPTSYQGSGSAAVALNPVADRVFAVFPNTASGSGTLLAIDGAEFNDKTLMLDATSVPAATKPTNPMAVLLDPNPGFRRVYVLDSNNALLVPVDAGTGQTDPTGHPAIPVGVAGYQPVAMALDPLSERIFVAEQAVDTSGNATDANGVVVMADLAAGSVSSPVQVGIRPFVAAAVPATGKVFIGNKGASSGTGAIASVTLLDAAQPTSVPPVTTTLAAGLTALVVDSAHLKVYAATTGGASSSQGDVWTLDAATGAAGTSLAVGQDPTALALDPVAGKLYVANAGDGASPGSVWALTLLPSLADTGVHGAVGVNPQLLAVDPTTGRVFAANAGTSGQVFTGLFGSTYTQLAQYSFGLTPSGLQVDTATGKAFVTDSGKNALYVLDPALHDPSANAVEANVVMGLAPTALALDSATGTAYVANSEGSSLAEVSLHGDPFHLSGQSGAITLPVTATFALTADVPQATLPKGVMPVTVYNAIPAFSVTAASSGAASGLPLTGLYWQMDDQVNDGSVSFAPWAFAAPSGAAGTGTSFTLQMPRTLSLGQHVLRCFAAYGNEGTAAGSQQGSGFTPEVSNVQTVPIFIVPSISTTVVLQAGTTSQVAGQAVTFTATVTAAGTGGSAGGPSGNLELFDGSTQVGLQVLSPTDASTSTASLAVTSLAAGSHTLTATFVPDSGSAFATSTSPGVPVQITAPPAPAALTYVSGNGQVTQVGSPFANPLVVTVLDAGGNPLSGVDVTFSLVISGQPQSLTATSGTTGQASLTLPALPASLGAVTLQITASVPGVTATVAFTETLQAPAPSLTLAIQGGNNQTTSAGAAFPSALQVLVSDGNGKPVLDVPVTFTLAGQSAPFATVYTGMDGIAGTFLGGAAVASAGSLAITAATGGQTVSFSETVAAPAPTLTLAIQGGNGQTTSAGVAFASPLQVLVSDGSGNPVANLQVTFTLAGQPTPFATVYTGKDGIAGTTLGGAAVASAGSLAITAAAGGQTVAFAETVAVAALYFTVPPPSAPVTLVNGQATDPFTVGAHGTLASTVTFAAQGPAGLSFAFSTASGPIPAAGLTLAPGTTAEVTLTVSEASMGAQAGLARGPGLPGAGGMGAAALLLGACLALPGRRRRRWLGGLLGVLVLGLTFAATGCGGHGSSPAAPGATGLKPGTYPVTLTISSTGAAPVTATVDVVVP